MASALLIKIMVRHAAGQSFEGDGDRDEPPRPDPRSSNGIHHAAQEAPARAAADNSSCAQLAFK